MLRLLSMLFCLAMIPPFGCSGAKEEARLPEMGPLGRGQARIRATVVEVDPARSTRPSDPCARAPCGATVRVDSVLGYGGSFARPLSKGERLRVRFGFTLAPTEDVMPDLPRAYPGLAAGDAFLADVHAVATPAPALQGTAAPFAASFVVYDYYHLPE